MGKRIIQVARTVLMALAAVVFFAAAYMTEGNVLGRFFVGLTGAVLIFVEVQRLLYHRDRVDG